MTDRVIEESLVVEDQKREGESEGISNIQHWEYAFKARIRRVASESNDVATLLIEEISEIWTYMIEKGHHIDFGKMIKPENQETLLKLIEIYQKIKTIREEIIGVEEIIAGMEQTESSECLDLVCEKLEENQEFREDLKIFTENLKETAQQIDALKDGIENCNKLFFQEVLLRAKVKERNAQRDFGAFIRQGIKFN